MKTKLNSLIFISISIGMFVLGAFLSCSNGETPDPEFIPSIPQLWQDGDINGANSTHSIVWQYDPDGCPTSAPCHNEGFFTGVDTFVKDGTSHNCSFSGSFKNHHFEWFYPENFDNSDCPIKGAFFSGTINDSSTVITATSPTLGNLVLRKH